METQLEQIAVKAANRLPKSVVQPNSFRYTQACSVTGGQDYALFSTSNASEEMYDFLRAQNDGQFLRLLGKRKHIRKGPFPLEVIL